MLRWLFIFSLLLPARPALPQVPTVTCPAQPPVVRTLNLVERWRLSIEDEDAPLVGVISQVRAAEPGGNLYLLDRQLCQILIYTADGELLDIIGREGDGPGEFRRPYDFILRQDGTVAIKDGWPSKLVYLNPDGTPAGGWAPQATLSLGHLHELPDGWLANGQNQDEARREPNRIVSNLFLSRFNQDGEQVQDFLTGESVQELQPQTRDERQPYFPHGRWDLTVDHQLVVNTTRDKYRLEYFNLDGTLQRVVERDFTPYRRTDADKDEIRDGNRVYMNGVKQEIVCYLLDTEPAISGMSVQADGTLRVTTCYGSRDLPERVVFRHDIHGPNGELLEERRIKGDCDLDYDRLRLLSDGRAVVLRNYGAAILNSLNMAEEGDKIREEAGFEVIVCDLVEVAGP